MSALVVVNSLFFLLLVFLVTITNFSEAVQLIQNPSFETNEAGSPGTTDLGTLVPWTTAGTGTWTTATSYGLITAAQAGHYFAVLEGHNTAGTLSQSNINVVPGQNYALSFYVRKGNDGQVVNCSFTLSGPSLPGIPVLITGCNTITGGIWNHITTTITVPPGAGPDTLQLAFAFQDGNPTVSAVALDAVTLEGQAVIVGDPQFIGLKGQTYQVHGIDGAVYNLISHPTLQLNARFSFLQKGRCPTFKETGGDISPQSNCYAHPGSYIGEVGLQQLIDKEEITIIIIAGPAATGFTTIEVNGDDMHKGDTIKYGSFSLNYSGSHIVSIKTSLFDFEFENSDQFLNQKLTTNVRLSTLRAHGLLGQTSRTPVKAGSIRAIEGEVDDYVIASDILLGNDFIYNKYKIDHLH